MTALHRREFHGIDWSTLVATPHRRSVEAIAADGSMSEIVGNAHPSKVRKPPEPTDWRPLVHTKLDPYREDCTPGHHVWRFDHPDVPLLSNRHCVNCPAVTR